MVRTFTWHDLSCFKLVLLCLACIVFSEPSIHCANCDILKSYSTIDRRSNADHIIRNLSTGSPVKLHHNITFLYYPL